MNPSILGSISPDGKTLLSPCDNGIVHLHALSGGSSITFERMCTLHLIPEQNMFVHDDNRLDAMSASAFSSDGTKFAVSSQGGTVMVWDIRSSLPLKVIQTDRTRCVEPQTTVIDHGLFGWGTRSLKFGGRAGKELMVFTEVRSILTLRKLDTDALDILAYITCPHH